jgi:cystathionine gamma-synthase
MASRRSSIFKLKTLESSQLSYSKEDLGKLQPVDLVHIETAVNPYGIPKSIKYFSDKPMPKLHSSVDSTFGPIPLQDPFKIGADIFMHATTKYFSGHRDLLAGVMALKINEIKRQLTDDRIYLGSLEACLLLRFFNFYETKIKRQSDNALKVVTFLHDNSDNYSVLKDIYHF